MARILTLDMSGPDVGDVQRRLNAASPTRLPRLVVDKSYGVLTMARVMEFQWQRHLMMDGACGDATLQRLPSTAGVGHAHAPSGRCILVDLVRNRLNAYHKGRVEIEVSPVHGGSPDAPTTRGVFPMSHRRVRHHTSTSYPYPPDNMQFALYFNGAQAIHLGPPTEPSHGCIHVGPPHAERLFHWAGDHEIVVIVVKRHR